MPLFQSKSFSEVLGMKTKRLLTLAGILLFSLMMVIGCYQEKADMQKTADQPEKVQLTIAAAASLQDALKELKTIYTKEHSNVDIVYNFASSGTLQKQIEEGAPADLFISAGKSQMDVLAEKGLLVDSSRRDLLGNKLVLIAVKDSPLASFTGLTDKSIAKISIGTPETVPAGKYAQEALVNLKLWDIIQSKLVPAKDVRQVLTYVETGNVDAGLVYKSDTVISDNIKIVAVAPESSHKPIVYPMAVVKSSKNQPAAQDFAKFLLTDEAGRIFAKYGFEPIK